MKKTFLLLISVFLFFSPLYAANITFKIDGEETKIIKTDITPPDYAKDAFLEGYYDAYMDAKENKSLYVIYEEIDKKSFEENSIYYETECKNWYLIGFKDFMKNYCFGSMGNFEEIYNFYKNEMEKPANYLSSCIISEYGKSRYFLQNIE